MLTKEMKKPQKKPEWDGFSPSVAFPTGQGPGQGNFLQINFSHLYP